MTLREYFSNYWLSIRDKRVWTTDVILLILAQQVSVIGSPLSIKLVEMTRAIQNVSGRPSNVHLSLDPYRGANHHVRDKLDGEDWFKFLLNPKRLLGCIKQYHSVGNGFFVAITIQLAANFYICAKAAFHKFFTGADRALAQFYADRYFPRVFHSYSNNDHLDTEVFYSLIFILSFRLSRLYALIRNSIINRNGYKHITAQQSNFSAIAHVLPLQDWKRFWDLMYDHQKDCDQNIETMSKHIRFADDIERAIQEKSQIEFIYFHNPISFEECHGVIETKCRAQDRVAWAKDWYVPEPVMRLDPVEHGWLITIALLGVPLAFVIAILIIVVSTTYELCAIAHDNNEQGCLVQVPSLLSSLSRMIRVFDVVIFVLSHLPSQIEGASFYWDCGIMISRIRKVREAIQEDMGRCDKFSRSNNFEYGISITDRRELNRNIRLHIRLLRCVYQEFLDLRWTHTFHFNNLLIGGGLLVSMGLKEMLVTESFLKATILSSMIIASAVQIGLSVLFCILVESAVSST